MGAVRRERFLLARMLHKTVAQIEAEVSTEELKGWRVFLEEQESG